MATLKDIARVAGLSLTQVSRALNDHADVSEATRKRVKSVAQTLNYQPNLLARKLVSGRSDMVGLVVPRSTDLAEASLFIEVVAGLSMRFSDRGMQFVLHVARRDEPILPVYERLVAKGALDGFVLIDPDTEDPRVAFLSMLKVPFVVHGRIGDAPRHAYFDVDNHVIIREIAEVLTGLGHRRIGFISGIASRSYVEARLEGYRQALAASGIDFDPRLVTNGNMTEAHGLVSTIRMFSDPARRPTAIICGNVRIARGVYQALGALGLRIPEDVSVMAHDDAIAGYEPESFLPFLSATLAPLRDSWGPLADCLVDTLNGAPLGEVQRVGAHRLVMRDSVTGAPDA